MLEAHVFFTALFFINAILIYLKNKSIAEFLFILFMSFVILLFLSIVLLPIEPVPLPIIFYYIFSLIVLFFAFGGKRPLQKWKKIFCEFRAEVYGREYKNVVSVKNFDYYEYKRYLYSKKNSRFSVLSLLITIILFLIWTLFIK